MSTIVDLFNIFSVKCRLCYETNDDDICGRYDVRAAIAMAIYRNSSKIVSYGAT